MKLVPMVFGCFLVGYAMREIPLQDWLVGFVGIFIILCSHAAARMGLLK